MSVFAPGKGIDDLLDTMDIETRQLGWRLARAGLEHFEGNIKKNTPVSIEHPTVQGHKISKPLTPLVHLRESYEQTDVQYDMVTTDIGFAAYAWTGKVFTQVEYAPFVEHGTGLWGPRHAKYIIKPKTPGGVLAFTPYAHGPSGDVVLDVAHNVTTTGKTVFARFVMHPGSPGHAMFRVGALLTEHDVERWAAEPLRLWKEAIERGGLRHDASLQVLAAPRPAP